MDFIGEAREEEHFLKNIFNRFRKRDFSGTTGQAMKNSSYQLTQNIIFKIGSLLFTIIIARMLMPELFGLYSLALATIVLFVSFSDLGIGSAVMTFVSEKLGQNDSEKAKGYLKKLLKWKFYIVFIAAGILMGSAYFVAEIYYSKPIFSALLAGGFYIIIVSLLGFLENLFKTTNNFKPAMNKEILFQISRFILVPLSILFLLKMNLNPDVLIAFVILSLVISYLISFLYLIIKAKTKIDFLKVRSKKINEKEKRELKKFILPLSAMALSGIFFGYIDTLMLGHYVPSQFIAYYGAAFSLIGGASAIIGFAAVSLLPIFARKSGKSLEKIFKKTRNFTFLIAILAGVFTYFAAWWAIRLAYGISYLEAVPILKYFSILIIILPITGLYDSYLISQKKTKVLAWLLVLTTILNIILNYVGITYGLRFGMFEAVLGACFATIISRVVYFGGIVVLRRRKN